MPLSVVSTKSKTSVYKQALRPTYIYIAQHFGTTLNMAPTKVSTFYLCVYTQTPYRPLVRTPSVETIIDIHGAVMHTSMFVHAPGTCPYPVAVTSTTWLPFIVCLMIHWFSNYSVLSLCLWLCVCALLLILEKSSWETVCRKLLLLLPYMQLLSNKIKV